MNSTNYYLLTTNYLKTNNYLKRALLLFTTLLLFTGCSSKRQQPSPDFVKPLFILNDSLYDDRGPGTYTYPVALQDRDGIFDLKTLVVRDVGSSLEFEVVFLRPIHREGVQEERYQKGWVHQLIDIYLDLDRIPGSGYQFSLPGRDVEFKREEAWDRMILLTPGPSRDVEDYLTGLSENKALYEARTHIIVPDNVFVKTFSIIARVPKSRLGPMVEQPGIQVCVMGFSPDNLSLEGMQNAEVLRFPTQDSFGGGTEAHGESNLIDILSPDRDSQYQVLSAYRSSPYKPENLHPILPLIYPKSKQKAEKFRRKSTNRNETTTKPLIEDRYMSAPQGW